MEENKIYLDDLIDRLAGYQDGVVVIGRTSKSWQAHREAEKIDNNELLPLLSDTLNLLSDENRIEALFFILLCLAQNTKDVKIIDCMISYFERIQLDDFDHDIRYSLMRCATRTNLKFSGKIDSIVYWMDDDHEMVRNESIKLIGQTSNYKSEAENALIQVLECPYDDYGIRFAADSLFEVGSKKCIPYLKSVLENLEDMEAISSVRRTLKKLM